jgi:hypothetical protein
MLCIEEIMCLAKALLFQIENDNTLSKFEKMQMNGLLDKICRKQKLSMDDIRAFNVNDIVPEY